MCCSLGRGQTKCISGCAPGTCIFALHLRSSWDWMDSPPTRPVHGCRANASQSLNWPEYRPTSFSHLFQWKSCTQIKTKFLRKCVKSSKPRMLRICSTNSAQVARKITKQNYNFMPGQFVHLWSIVSLGWIFDKMFRYWNLQEFRKNYVFLKITNIFILLLGKLAFLSKLYIFRLRKLKISHLGIKSTD